MGAQIQIFKWIKNLQICMNKNKLQKILVFLNQIKRLIIIDLSLIQIQGGKLKEFMKAIYKKAILIKVIVLTTFTVLNKKIITKINFKNTTLNNKKNGKEIIKKINMLIFS